MRINDAPNAGFRRLVVEKDAPASIHLDVDESGGKDRLGREAD
jgi:hypothetical protein